VCVCVCVRGILCLSVADGKWNETEIRRPFGLWSWALFSSSTGEKVAAIPAAGLGD